ncbi:hypothetical protein JTF08_11260 [Micrococcaceae bacterium RIT802]|nr:hypothetical protein [Micrococcaceae bacterium RIT 802]
MKLPVYLALIERSEETLAASYRVVSEGHAAEPDVHFLLQTLASQCDKHRRILAPVLERHQLSDESDVPESLHHEGLSSTRSGPLGLLRDLQDLYLAASLVDITWTMLLQAGQGLADRDLIEAVQQCDGETSTQLGWLRTRMKQAAPQALIAAG